MISVQLQGGLGNMMFQIAFIESLGKKYGFDVAYNGLSDNFRHIKTDYTRSPHADDYLSIFHNVYWEKNQDRLHEIKYNQRIPFHYVDVEPGDETNYIGYFQSEDYFYSPEFVRELFYPASVVREELKDYTELLLGTTCSIHIRRADYMKLQGYHPFPGIEYYEKAIDTLKPFNIDTFLVFSDDMDWCCENFKGDRFVFVTHCDYIEMFLMSKCTHNIIANSSFSWFGAYLGEPIDRIVIAPKNWLGPECRDDPKDIIPQKWIRL